MNQDTILAGFVVATAASLGLALLRGTGRAHLIRVNLGLALCGTFALLAGCEVYYRFFYDTTDAFTWAKTTKAWTARHWRTNNLGRRDNIDYDLKRGPRRRVTFVGDSFTVGHGVADVEARFTNLVRAQKPELEVHVFARNGADTALHLSMVAEALAQGYELDEVVLVTLTNDICDIIEPWEAVRSAFYRDAERLPSLIRESFALNLFYYRYRRLTDPSIGSYYAFMREAYAGPLWARQQQRLRAFHKLVEGNGGRLSVVFFPMLDRPLDTFAFEHQQLEAFWRSVGVPTLDLRNAFAQRDLQPLVVNSDDPHPNAAAHAIAAQAIVPFLGSSLNSERPPPIAIP